MIVVGDLCACQFELRKSVCWIDDGRRIWIESIGVFLALCIEVRREIDVGGTICGEVT